MGFPFCIRFPTWDELRHESKERIQECIIETKNEWGLQVKIN